MVEDKLNPCLCGSDVELRRGDDDYYIYCPKCKLKTYSDRVYDNITDNCDRLIEVWNRVASYRQVKGGNNGTDFTNDITGNGKL